MTDSKPSMFIPIPTLINQEAMELPESAQNSIFSSIPVIDYKNMFANELIVLEKKDEKYDENIEHARH